jgi:predicted nucleic acid-binding protein
MLVLDVSVLICLAYKEERAEAAGKVVAEVAQRGAVVPTLFWFELRNGLLMGERRKRISQAMAEKFLKSVDTLPLTVDDLKDSDVVMSLARQHGLTVYDAAYLELAKRVGLPLATLDGALRQAALEERVALAIATV